MSDPYGNGGSMQNGGGFRPGGGLDDDDSLGSDDWFLPADSQIQQPLPMPDQPSVPPIPQVPDLPAPIPPSPPVQEAPAPPVNQAPALVEKSSMPVFPMTPAPDPPLPPEVIVPPIAQPVPSPVEPVAPPAPPAVPAFFYCRKGSAGKRLFEFETDRALIGRSSGCDLIVEDRFAGRRHAEILYQEGVWKLLDLSSANGTTVNERRVGRDMPNPVVLCDGDVIVIGDTEFVFKQIV